MNKIRPLAIYLPQFHPIPENDLWWEKGFTEWTNVTRAQPRFKGHYQPHLPADLGFYDLRLEESRVAQAEMAKQFGIYGFCYYHYWFNGRRILERPFNEVLKSGKPNFPFCLCWANENWSRTWDGADKELLLKQEHNFEDDENHLRYLCSAFKDERYIRVDGKPVFIIYRTQLFPDIKHTAAIWRRVAEEEGLPGLYLCAVERYKSNEEPETFGFDAAIEFQPDNFFLPERKWGTIYEKLFYRFKRQVLPYSHNFVYEYSEVMSNMLLKPAANYKRFPGITPAWDNSPRKKKDATIFVNATPELYHSWLEQILSNFHPYSKEENFIFINAWNEWAEGNHLEPCQKWGRSYLEVTKELINKFS
jgi:lipopolysaccharide biosynthesis protein